MLQTIDDRISKLNSYQRSWRSNICMTLLWVTGLPLLASAEPPAVAKPADLEFKQYFVADGLPSNAIMALYQDRKGFLWIGSSEGLLRYDGYAFKTYVDTPGDSSSLNSNSIWSISEDSRGILWIGTENSGLKAFDPGSETFTHYAHDPQDSTSLGSGYVLAIFEDHLGDLWVGLSEGGLCRLDRKTGKFRRFVDNPYDPTSFKGSFVAAFLEDRDQALWIASRGGGLNLFERETDSFVDLRPLQEDVYYPRNITGIAEGDSGEYWVSTLGSGMFHMTVSLKVAKRQLHFVHQDMGSQIPEADRIFRMFQDSSGQLWCATWGAGLFHFDPDSGSFNHYASGRAAAALSNDFVHCLLIDRSGVLWAGTDNGLNKASLMKRKVDNSSPQLELTNLLLFNKRVSIRDVGSVLKADIAYSQSLILSHEQNDISFECAVLDYVDPRQNRYAYQLEGLDPGWSDTTVQNRVRYTELQPGSYVFKVRGSNSEGVWSVEPRELKVIILPDWWRTWWVYGLLGATAILVIIFLRRKARA